MESWLIVLITVVAMASIIGNLSALQKNAKQKLRSKGLNELKETLPRKNKKQHKMNIK
jgi:hypothetical protein